MLKAIKYIYLDILVEQLPHAFYLISYRIAAYWLQNSSIDMNH